MSPRSWLSSHPHTVSRRPRTRLAVESLENRDVPSALTVGDATAVEGGTAYRFTDFFVGPDGYGLASARDTLVGPDGNVYVASHDTDVVKVFEGGTGRFLRDLTASGGELDGPWGMTFGPDGGLYVGGRNSLDVIRFDTSTGASAVFVPANSGGLESVLGLTFGPDGNLYATSNQDGPNDDSVKRYDGTTGTYLGDFVPAGSGGLSGTNGLAFGPDGNLYVPSVETAEVKRYNGQTGAFIDNFVIAGSGGVASPRRLTFRDDGNLYVGGGPQPGIVYRYNATSGAFVDVFVAGPSGPTVVGSSIPAFAADGVLYDTKGTPTGVAGSVIERFAPTRFAAFTVSLSAASSSPVSVDFSTADGTAFADSDYVGTSGTITFAPGELTRTILVQTLNDSLAEGKETFTLNLSNPTGATITDGTGMGTITDDDATKFFVADDGGTDRTYRYGAPGNAQANTTLGSGNSAPRGAASTAAGDKVWVVDANKKVYVYDAAGNLLGSWTAGSLASNAQVEGITTNGTDIWIVDNKQNKVFKYAGAATRLSGSQNATSSFNLNSSNTSPKDLVTDGASIWVVNDSSTDKVFKYTLSGSYQGNWTLSGGGGSPTGITLDPSAPSHLWVVDNATDRVYQYDNAVSRTSGSQSASTSFALAAGNTNPQGIADPPVPQPPAASSHHWWGFAAPLDADVLLDRMAAWRKRR